MKSTREHQEWKHEEQSTGKYKTDRRLRNGALNPTLIKVAMHTVNDKTNLWGTGNCETRQNSLEPKLS